MTSITDEMKAAAGSDKKAGKKREAVMDRGEQIKATASYIPKVKFVSQELLVPRTQLIVAAKCLVMQFIK